MSDIAGVLHWMATGSLEETGKGEKVERLPFIFLRLLMPWVVKLMMMRLNAYG